MNEPQSSPLIQDSVSPIPTTATNQLQANQEQINNLKRNLKSTPKFASCPFCRNQGETRVEKKLNVPNLIFGIVTVGLLWLPTKLIRSKDMNCYDAKHYCMKCKGELSNYSAC